MLILEANQLKKHYGTRCVVDVPKLKIYDGEKIGLVGANGAGKSTLLKILASKLTPDEGQVVAFGKTYYLPQLEYSPVEAGDYQLSKWNVKDTTSSHSSGGEKTRLKLAKCFSDDYPLLLIDEPTANLDFAGLEQLEKDLREHSGSLLLVSHDRQLLDNVCNQIIEVERDGRLNRYTGNYQSYRLQKDEEVERARQEYVLYQQERKRLEQAVQGKKEQASRVRKAPSRMGNSEARLHKRAATVPKAKLEKQVQSLRSRIEQLEHKEKPPEENRAQIDLQGNSLVQAKFPLKVEGLSKAYGRRELFQDASFMVKNKSKTALLGPNGCGKTTLIKLLIENGQSVWWSPQVKLGYFSQELAMLDRKKTLWENIEQATIHSQSFSRTVLARLLFSSEQLSKEVAVLSGGELVKASLAQLVLGDYNFLLLDEPTNYLDIPSLEALSRVLCDYQGTVLFVSHDRRFIDQVATDLLVFEDRKILTFSGNYSAYLQGKTTQTGGDELVLRNRLAELTSKLSMPGPDDDIQALDAEFKETLQELRQMDTKKP